MKLLLILVSIVGLGWWSWHRFSAPADAKPSLLEGAMSKALKPTLAETGQEKPAAPQTDRPTRAGASGSLFAPPSGGLVGRPETPRDLEEAKTVRVHRFTYRPGPKLEQATQSLGVEVTVDDASRSVIFRGDEKAVAAASAVFEALDLAAESCVLRAWVIYVDRNLGSGWDLTAAIRAVSGVDIGATVGGGTVSLDLASEELTAVLAVICDNEGVDLVQKPVISLRHGVPATVALEQEVPLATSVLAASGVSQAGVSYRNVGLSVTVEPYFLGRNRVVLGVEQRNGVIGASQDLGSGLRAPVIETQRLTSSVEVAIGQSVVLGGVETSRLRRFKGFLGDKTERRNGFVYVVLATAADAPRARVPGESDAPLSDRVPDAVDFLGRAFLEEVLPPKGWEAQERDFLKARAAKW